MLTRQHTRSALRHGGWTDAGIDNALRRGGLVAVTHGALVPAAHNVDHIVRCAAALTSQRWDAAISHRAAAVLHRLRWLPPTWLLDDQPIDVTAVREDLSRGARAGLRRRVAALPSSDVVVRDGLRVTSVARTLIDLARTEPRLLAIQIADGALTDGACTVAELAAVCDHMARLRGVLRAREMVARARAGVDSPPESTIRMRIVDAGLPEPMVAVEIVESGVVLARADLAYRELLIWIEYDGWDVHGTRIAFGRDRGKDRWLRGRGWEVMRVYADDAACPDRFLRELAAAINAAPARIAALDPTRSPEVAWAQARLLQP